MKLLIVGGAGYLGSVLIPKLLDRVYRVAVVDGRAGQLGMRFHGGVPWSWPT
jgi:nucleoside-diphosphate-sugar epimerase